MKKFFALLVIVFLAAAGSGNGQTVYFQGFETDISGWDVFGGTFDAVRVASGTNSIASKTGSFHGEAVGSGVGGTEAGSAATNWGVYNSTFPTNGYITKVDVYLDLSATSTNDTRFDFSSAINDAAGSHRRDFVFNAGFYNDSDATGSSPRFVISASNNASRSGAYPKNPGRNPFSITTSGWYTLQHKFYDAGGGVLAVDLSIIDGSGTTIKTWTLTDATDIIGSTIGGNRYGWFANNEFSFLAIDNSERIDVLSCIDEVYVDAATGSDANMGDSPANAKLTVQAGVDMVCEGGTVYVAAGTYVEQVTIAKSLQLLGADAATTIIKAPSTIPVASNPASSVVDINGAGVDVEITGFTVSGPGPTGCGSIGYGIFVGGSANADIHDNKILDIRDEPISGCQNGVGIQIGRSSLSTTGTATITDNEISGFQKNGITVDNAGSNATITGNTVTGAGAVTFIAQNGIQVSRGATAEVNNNTVSGHSYTPANWVSTGMLFYEANVNTDNNTVIENQIGIYHLYGSGLHQNNEVTASSVGTGSPYFYGIIVDPGDNLRVIPDPFDGLTTSNAMKASQIQKASTPPGYSYTLDKNVLTGDGSTDSYGIGAYALGTDVVDFTATGNTVTNWDYGIELYKEPDATLIANIIDCNQIYDNTSYGLLNTTGVSANAVGNWWGAASGPTHVSNPSGSGDVVSDDVVFTPFSFNVYCNNITPKPYIIVADENVKFDGTLLSDGDIHSNGDIAFHNDEKGTHSGNLSAVKDITIDKGVTIDGDATAKRIYEFGDITGTVTDKATVAEIPLPVLSYSAGGPDKTAHKKGSLTLAPGTYGKVKVEKKAVLYLSAGDYYMDELDTDNFAKIVINVDGGAAININVVKDFEIDDHVEIVIEPYGELGSNLVTFSTMQKNKVDIGKYSLVLGNIIAPKAEVHFSDETQFRGTVCAAKVTVEEGVPFLHHDSPASLPKRVVPLDDELELAELEIVPSAFSLSQNYPNPFNPTTVIRYQLPASSEVKLSIYNTTGQLVRTLVNGEMPAGSHAISWDATDNSGQRVASGVYLYIIRAGDAFVQQRKLILMK